MYKYGYIYTEFPLFLWAHAEQQSLDKGQHKGCKLTDMSRSRVQWQALGEMRRDTRTQCILRLGETEMLKSAHLNLGGMPIASSRQSPKTIPKMWQVRINLKWDINRCERCTRWSQFGKPVTGSVGLALTLTAACSPKVIHNFHHFSSITTHSRLPAPLASIFAD